MFIRYFIKSISLGIIAWAFCFCCIGQPASSKIIYDKLISIEDDTVSYENKLPKLEVLKKEFENSKLEEDSVYARILHRMGLYEYKINNDIATKNAIIFTQRAIRINSSGKKNSSPAFCVRSYANLGNCYKSLHLYNIALQYFDSSLLWRKKYFIPGIPIEQLQVAKAIMFYRTGDSEKAIEELNLAIRSTKQRKDSFLMPSLLNQRAQSYIMQDQLNEAAKDLDSAARFSQLVGNSDELINSMLLKGEILAKNKDFSKAVSLYKQGIKQRIQTNNYNQISDDYTDLGNIYLNKQDYAKAKECYLNTINYALEARDFERLAKGHINLEQCSFRQGNFKEAEQFCIEAMKDLSLPVSNDILENISASSLGNIGNSDLVLVILRSKTELLLTQFRKTQNRNYLSACLQTAMLTDSIITKIRHQQLGKQSKFYWRSWTREFFTQAMEASYLKNDPKLAFYFMEKSRAVLLNDQLNELGAAASLPKTEAEKERQLQIAIISEEQSLSLLQADEAAYEAQQEKLLLAKADLEHYIKSLESRFPSYYQYKYADEVPDLATLQAELLKNKQSFIHYFMDDTVAYVLGITSSDPQFIKLSKDKFNSGQLINFLQKCSYEPGSNDEYLSFASLSFSLYQLLFQPLKIPKGRVVICPDNILIPFEALSTDHAGNNFLVSDYVFSYVYSARYLLKQDNTYQADEDFIGFAPVSFKAFPRIVDLKQSADALRQASLHYSSAKLFTNDNATRYNFINDISRYAIANVFSHARADTTDNEPVLYMHDSIIYLSELQLLNKPATKLVVLSACQTSVGKTAKGEGILSLARGFASAGVPAVAATLWQADEQSIYAISEKFHEYLAQGISKDEALHKAKLHIIQNGEFKKPHPYYWANLILVGNATPVILSQHHHYWWWMGGIVFILALVLLMRQLRKGRQS